MQNQYLNRAKGSGWIILILIVAAILRLYHLGFQSPWMDELYTLNISNPDRSLSEMFADINLREGFPYLYFVLVKAMLAIFGYTTEVARLFSVIMGVASVYMMYRFGKLLFNANTGLMAAAITAFSEYCLYTSQDARPYTFYFFAVVLSFYGLVKFAKDPNLKNAVIYGLCASLLLNSNFFSVINLVSQAAILLWLIGVSAKERRLPFFKFSAIAGVIAILLFLPNYKILLKLMAFQSAWIPYPTRETFSLMFNEFLGNSEITLFIFTPLFLYFLIDLFNTPQTKFTYEAIINDRKIFGFVILLPWFSFVLIGILLKTYLDTPITITRYLVSILPVAFLVFAFAIDLIRNSLVRYSVLGLVVFFMFFNLIAVQKYYKTPNKTQFREAAEFVLRNNKGKEPVVTSLKYWFDYFFTKEKVPYAVTEKPSLEAVIGEMMQDPSKVRAFWYIDAHGRPFALSDAAQQFVSSHFYVENNFDGFDSWGRHYILLKDAPKEVDISKFKELQPVNGDAFSSNIETFEYANDVAKVAGWAYFAGQPAAETTIEILLIKDGKGQRFSTEKVLRNDVTTYFKSDFDLGNSGFAAVYNSKDLEPGRYQIAIYLVNKATKKEGLALTDKYLDKK